MLLWFAGLVRAPDGVAQSAASFYLHGTTATPPSLFLNTSAPTGSTAKSANSAAVNFAGGNPWQAIGTWPASSILTAGNLTALSDLHVWVGLKNSDDQGTQFDLRAEAYKNTTLVAASQTLCITGVTLNPSNAKEILASFGSFAATTFNGSSDVLSLKLLARIGTNPDGTKCSGPGGSHNNAQGLRLYYDSTNRPASFSATIVTASTPPTITASVSPAPNAASWNNSNVTVSFTCTAGSSPIQNCSPPLAVSTEGANQVITGTATDTAGRSATTNVTVNLDKTPPTIAPSASPAPNADGWNHADVTVSFVCGDSLSGMGSCPAPATVSAEGAGQTISGTATDVAGNSASASASIKLDKTLPALSITSPANGATVTHPASP